jgi:hypothetical protein
MRCLPLVRREFSGPFDLPVCRLKSDRLIFSVAVVYGHEDAILELEKRTDQWANG